MVRIIRDQWAKNEAALREALLKTEGLNSCNYVDLVKLAFEHVFNRDGKDQVDLEDITEINLGHYGGALVFVMHIDKGYCASAEDCLMTHIQYGSCSACDTLLSIQDDVSNAEYITEGQADDLMLLCKDILLNTIKPYNRGLYYDGWYDDVEL